MTGSIVKNVAARPALANVLKAASLGALLFLACCPLRAAADSAPVVVTDKDDGHTVAVAVGQVLEVRLPSNPSTGYQWTAGALKTGALNAQRPPVYEGSKPQLPGSGGTEVFTYQGAAAGTEHLSFAYSRPWEKVEPAKRVAITITVQQQQPTPDASASGAPR